MEQCQCRKEVQKLQAEVNVLKQQRMRSDLVHDRLGHLSHGYASELHRLREEKERRESGTKESSTRKRKRSTHTKESSNNDDIHKLKQSSPLPQEISDSSKPLSNTTVSEQPTILTPEYVKQVEEISERLIESEKTVEQLNSELKTSEEERAKLQTRFDEAEKANKQYRARSQLKNDIICALGAFLTQCDLPSTLVKSFIYSVVEPSKDPLVSSKLKQNGFSPRLGPRRSTSVDVARASTESSPALPSPLPQDEASLLQQLISSQNTDVQKPMRALQTAIFEREATVSQKEYLELKSEFDDAKRVWNETDRAVKGRLSKHIAAEPFSIDKVLREIHPEYVPNLAMANIDLIHKLIKRVVSVTNNELTATRKQCQDQLKSSKLQQLQAEKDRVSTEDRLRRLQDEYEKLKSVVMEVRSKLQPSPVIQEVSTTSAASPSPFDSPETSHVSLPELDAKPLVDDIRRLLAAFVHAQSDVKSKAKESSMYQQKCSRHAEALAAKDLEHSELSDKFTKKVQECDMKAKEIEDLLVEWKKDVDKVEKEKADLNQRACDLNSKLEESVEKCDKLRADRAALVPKMKFWCAKAATAEEWEQQALAYKAQIRTATLGQNKLADLLPHQ